MAIVDGRVVDGDGEAMAYDYRNGYEHELARREALGGALGTPVTIVSLLAAALAAMLGGLRDDAIGLDVAAFWAVAAVALIFLIRSVDHLARSLHGHTYKAIESPLRLRRHHDELRAWHQQYGEGPLRGDREFAEYLEKTYAEATEHNQRINEYRGDQLYLGQRWMIVAAIATGAAWTACVANQQLHDEPPQRVVVTELHLDRSQAPMSSKPATPPPPKPEPPPLRDLRQGHVPRPSSTGAAPTRPQR